MASSPRSRQEKPRKIRWILFDLDGTLADSLGAMFRAYLSFLEEFGQNGSRKEFTELNGPSLDQIVGILRKRYRITTSHTLLFKKYTDNVSTIYQTEISPMKEANNVLDVLYRDGYRLGLVTSSVRKIARNFVISQGWEKYFSKYVFGDDVKEAKPSPEIYLNALNKIRVLPDAAVVVEDSINGVKSARSAGLLVVGISSARKELLNNGAYKVVKNLSGVISVIKGLK
jgi:beta-phosphoglucomutase